MAMEPGQPDPGNALISDYGLWELSPMVRQEAF